MTRCSGICVGGIGGGSQPSGRLPTVITGGGVGSHLIGTLRLIERKQGATCNMDAHSQMAMHHMETEGPHWSLLKVQAQKQMNYVQMLGDHCPGVEAYYPQYSRMVRRHGYRRAKEETRPVFPGYVFLMVGSGRDMHGPVSLPVRATWVRFGGVVESVPDRVIQGLRKMEGNGELVREMKNVDPYVAGARVRVCTPVYTIHGVIVRLVGVNRAVVDTSLCRVTVPKHRIQIL